MADKRIQRDRRTLEAIGAIYCKGNHKGAEKDAEGLCSSCREAIEGTLERTIACPYGHENNCEDCDIKCQRGEAQERIRAIMRYAAPRMLLRHPVMTIEYLRKKRRGEA